VIGIIRLAILIFTKMKKKIVAVTGARSEYDILSPLLEALRADEHFEVSVIVTGSHLSETYGYTKKYIEQDGYTIIGEISNLVEGNDKLARILSIGNQINPLAEILNIAHPDFVLVVGDREEAITTTMVCAYLDIPVCHIAGGDIAKDGNIDNSTRYAASKYAHIHFTILEQHKQNLMKLGEDEWRIHNVGNPALDKFISTPLLSLSEINAHLGSSIIDDFILVIYHPIITAHEREAEYARELFSALRDSGKYIVMNSPNSDAGNVAILNEMEAFVQNNESVYWFKNLPREVYVNLMRHASLLVGNSSSGIIEAPSLGLPVINVGERQRGRFHSNNVTFVNPVKSEVLSAINNVFSEKGIKERLLLTPNPYGAGDSSVKIIKALSTINSNSNLLHKNITY
jgi:UDP-hydrolysing UDP-N-acetyl-D-glucosamine 2-epimerase